MAVTVTFSSAAGSGDFTEITHQDGGGDIAAGNTSDPQDVYIRHDAANDITDCKFFMAPFSVSAHANANADYLEMLEWGDGLAAGGPAEANEFGGVQLNMDRVGNFDATTPWPTFGSEGSATDKAVACRTGVGDNASNGIELNADAHPTTETAGVITAGSNTTQIQLRVEVPTDEATTGERKFDLRMRFTFTS